MQLTIASRERLERTAHALRRHVRLPGNEGVPRSLRQNGCDDCHAHFPTTRQAQRQMLFVSCPGLGRLAADTVCVLSLELPTASPKTLEPPAQDLSFLNLADVFFPSEARALVHQGKDEG